MIVKDIQRKLADMSTRHREDLARLGKEVQHEPLSSHVQLLAQTPQVRAMNTILRSPATSDEDFVFYFDRLVTLLVERSGITAV